MQLLPFDQPESYKQGRHKECLLNDKEEEEIREFVYKETEGPKPLNKLK